MSDDAKYLNLAKDLLAPVRNAGSVIMDIHRCGVIADMKSDGSPVTEADHAAEQILLAALGKFAPDITVISEENAASHLIAPQDRFFLVDPLDGTKEFIQPEGAGAFTVNIGLIEKGVPVMGIVFAPALDRMFYGVQNHGSFEISVQHEARLRVRETPATVTAIASRSHPNKTTDDWLQSQGITQISNIGSSLKFCLLAAGEADVYPRFGPTMEWDSCAGDAILRAAGGITLHPDGLPFTYGKADYLNGDFIACGGFVPSANPAQ